MGCGCKAKSNKELVNEKTGELNIKGKLIKLPTAIIVTVLLIILSPFLLLFVWYLAMRSVFDNNANLVNAMLLKYNKFKSEPENDEDEEFNPSEYELVDVDKIK